MHQLLYHRGHRPALPRHCPHIAGVMRTGGELHKPRDFHLPVSHYRIGKHTGVSCSLCHRETRPVTKGANKPEGKAALDQARSALHWPHLRPPGEAVDGQPRCPGGDCLGGREQAASVGAPGLPASPGDQAGDPGRGRRDQLPMGREAGRPWPTSGVPRPRARTEGRVAPSRAPQAPRPGSEALSAAAPQSSAVSHHDPVGSLPAARWADTAGSGGIPGGHPRSRGLPTAQGLRGYEGGGRWLQGWPWK